VWPDLGALPGKDRALGLRGRQEPALVGASRHEKDFACIPVVLES